MGKVFLELEGIDGSGKSTVRQYIYKTLIENGQEVITIGQHSWLKPKYAEIIYLIRNRLAMFPPEMVIEAYAEDKKEHYRRSVMKNISQRHVIADRYFLSDLVYHEILFSINSEEVYDYYQNIGLKYPDYIVFIDTPPEQAYYRIISRNKPIKSWETQDNLIKLHQKYHQVLQSSKFVLPPIITIDNRGNLEECIYQINQKVLEPVFDLKL